MTTLSVPRVSLAAALGALECSSESHDAPATALREAVEALWTIAAQAAEEGAFDQVSTAACGASLRADLVQRSEGILLTVIRRGVAVGAFQPLCTQFAERGLVRALVAGACARWVFGLPEERSPRAGPAAEAALEVLNPRCAAALCDD